MTPPPACPCTGQPGPWCAACEPVDGPPAEVRDVVRGIGYGLALGVVAWAVIALVVLHLVGVLALTPANGVTAGLGWVVGRLAWHVHRYYRPDLNPDRTNPL